MGAGGAGGAGGADVTFAALPSRGSSVASDEEGTTLAAANKASDTVTLFDRATTDVRAKVIVGDEPTSMVFSPDGTTLYVVNRASQSVSVIADANGKEASVVATLSVGSEPGHAALSPSGRTLYVSNWADGSLSVIDTLSRDVDTVDLGGSPFAVCVTNDGDQDDSDETIYVTDFYSRAIDGVKEAVDGSRNGRVFAVSAAEHTVDEIVLEPQDVTGIDEAIDAAETKAFANQLYSCAVNGGHVYVTAVGASPAAFDKTTDFRQNLHGLVYAIDTEDNTVDDDRTVNLSELVAALAGEKRFAAVPHDIAFVPGTDLAYIATLTANAVLRVNFGAEPPEAGAANNNFLTTDPSPTGIAIFEAEAFTYNEVGRSVSRIDLAAQETIDPSITSEALPSAGSGESDALIGQKFFNTGLKRWSKGAWIGCVGCHPMGTTDNVTWVFPAGPRQTVDTSATFDQGASTQRILNWTAIFDEVHDFELNTRGVANGVGAIVSDAELDIVNRINFVGAGGVGNPDNGFNVGSAKGVNDDDGVLEDWDRIEDYIASIRAPRGRSVTAGDPEVGRAMFEAGKCNNCHGGTLWTLSERYYTPQRDGDLRNVTFGDEDVTSFGAVRADQVGISEGDLATTPILTTDGNGPPHRHVCSVRIVGTFDADGPAARGADEIRQNGNAAQGVDGFNVPSLLNINMGAPYLHNGAAESLEALLDPSGDFVAHLQAGNQVFSPSTQELADLIAFLQGIDDTTTTIAVPGAQQFCPEGVVPPT